MTRVLHMIYEPGHTAGLDVAREVARYAASGSKRLRVEIWAPKERADVLQVANRARKAGVSHRGVAAALVLRSFLVKENVSVVHCHDVHSAVTMGLLERTGRMPPTAYSVYAPLLEPTPARPLFERARRCFVRTLKAHMDAVIAPSAFARGVAISQGGFDPHKVKKVTYGVTLPPELAAAEAITDQVGIMLLPVPAPRNKRRASYDYFLHAGRLLFRQAGKAFLAIACDWRDRSYVQAAAARFGIRGKVRIGGPDSFPLGLGRCQVAVLPTGDLEGTRPLVMAMAAGKAVVAPDLGGVREFVDPEVTGVLVKASDSVALAESLGRLVSSDAARLRVAEAATRAARTRFSARRMAEELARTYVELARAHPSTPS